MKRKQKAAVFLALSMSIWQYRSVAADYDALSQGEQELHNGKINQALSICEKHLKVERQDEQRLKWLTLKGIAQTYSFGPRHSYSPFSSDNFTAAQKTLTQLPSNATAVAALSLVRSFSSRTEEGLSLAQKAMAINSSNELAQAALAYCLSRSHHEVAALRQIAKLLKQNPENFEALWIVLDCLSQISAKDMYKQELDRLVQLYPNSALALTRQGIYLRDTGEAQQATKILEKAITLNPELTDPRVALEKQYRASAQYKKAIPHLDKIISLEDTPEFRFARAESLAATNQPDKAIDDYDRGLAAWYQQEQARDLKTAVSRTAEDRKQKLKKAFLKRAQLLTQANKAQLSIPQLTEYLNVEPHDTRALYERYLAYRSLEQTNKALDDLNTLIALPKSTTPSGSDWDIPRANFSADICHFSSIQTIKNTQPNN